MKLRPLADNIVVRLAEAPLPQSVIKVVRLEKQPSWRGEVVAVGPDVRDVAAGNVVLVSWLQGIEVNLGEPLVLLPEAAVLAFV